MTTPFDFVKAVTHNKTDMFSNEECDTKQYIPFIVNKALMLYPDCLFYANDMNQHHFIDNDMQFHYYLNSIRPMKRYAKWVKRTDDENLEIVKQYYSYNNKKAKQVLSILSSTQIEEMKKQLQKGG